MAHYRNPDVFGEDVVGLGWSALGLAFTAGLDDHVVAPALKPLTASFAGSGMAAKVVDSVSTGVSAFAIGEVVGMVDSAVGRRMKLGGMILAAGRFISAFVPGFQISSTVPTSVSGLLSHPAAAGGKVATASSGSPATQSQPVSATPTPATPMLPPGSGTYPAYGSRLAANQNAAL